MLATKLNKPVSFVHNNQNYSAILSSENDTIIIKGLQQNFGKGRYKKLQRPQQFRVVDKKPTLLADTVIITDHICEQIRKTINIYQK